MSRAETVRLLSRLRRLGVQVAAQDGGLTCRAPDGVLTPTLRGEIAASRDAILAVLAAAERAPEFRPDPASRFEPFPLTDVQQAYLVGRDAAFDLGNVATHAYAEVDVAALDLDRLDAAWSRLVARHDMLRAVVFPDGYQQVLDRTPEWHTRRLDLRGQPTGDAAAALEAVRQEMSHQVFPLGRWPLFDVRAALLDGNRTRLFFGMDALIADSWSILCLVREWAALYQRPDCPAPPLDVTFRDCVLYQRALEATRAYERSRQYWLDRLETLAPAPELPLARAPGTIEQPRFGRRSARLEGARWQQLQQRARQAGVTPSGALLAAFAEVLARWAKTPRFTLNLTLFYRPPWHPRINEVVGDFTSLTLLEFDGSEREPFRLRAARVQRQLWQDLDHPHGGGVRVLRELARRRGGSLRAPMPVVFTSALPLGSFDRGDYDLLQRGEVVYSLTQTPQVWLDHQVMEQDGALVWNWDAVEQLFPDGLLDDMFASYRALLDRLADTDAAWDSLDPLQLPAWQAMSRAAANATAAPLSDHLLHTLFTAQAERRPEAPAVIAPERTLTYGDLYARAARLGRELRDRGAARNTLVAVVMEKGWEQAVAVLGVLLAGAAYVPLDPQQPADRLRALLARSEARLVVTQPCVAARIAWPDDVSVLTVDAADAPHGAVPPIEPAQAPEDLAYVIFTSGSTGTPKGVMIDHRGAVNTILDINRRFGVGADDRVLGVSSLGFDLSVYDLFGLWAAGGAVVLPAAGEAKDPAHWAELMRRHAVTVWNSVPALMGLLADDLERQPDRRPQALRLVLLSGDWIPVRLPERVTALCPGARVIGLGGATEASIWSNYFPVDRVEPEWTSIPYGKPLANQTFQVLNNRLEPCPVWTPGQLYIGGLGLAKGYWADPEQTAASFITHPRTGERLYRTGDLGRYLPDGNLEFLGREDSQVKLHGYRIELGEVEAALTRHPGVRAAVAAVSGAGDDARLVACVVPAAEDESLFRGEQVEPGRRDAVWRALRDAASREARAALPAPERLDALAAFDAAAERLSLAAMEDTLTRLGARAADGSLATRDIVARCGVLPRYEKLLGQWLAALAGAGRLRAESGVYYPVGPLDGEDRGALWERLDQAARAAGWGATAQQYLRDSLANLDRLLRGEQDPLALFFPHGALDSAESVYRWNPLAEYFHRVVREAVRAFAAARGDAPLRALEVGAGTGSTTAAVLPALPPERTVYHFTDLSPFFTEAARQQFRDRPFLRYGLLDIDREPADQGWEPHGFDLIIAANVLHDARRLEPALAGLRRLLAPGGLLLVLEATRDTALQMVTVRLLEGFSHYEDERLQTNQPLLSAEQWRAALAAAGFEASAAFPGEDSPAALAGHAVVAARAPSCIRRFDAAPLDAFLKASLPAYMVPSAYVPLASLPLSANGKVDRKALRLPEARVPAASARTVAPRTPLERDLCRLWAEVLGSPEPGVEDDFFAVGGDSLLASRLMTRLRQMVSLELPLRLLFEGPTVAALAARVEAVRAAVQLIGAAAGQESGAYEEGEF